MRLLKAVLILCVLPACAASSGGSSPLEADSPKDVVLCGPVHREVRFGPPGFGDTPKIDLKRSIWLLDIPAGRLFLVHQDGSSKVISLKKVQLKAVGDQRIAAGKHGCFRGLLSSQTTESDYTEVVLDVK